MEVVQFGENGVAQVGGSGVNLIAQLEDRESMDEDFEELLPGA